MSTPVSTISFDGWTLYSQTGELSRGERTTRLQDQPLQILLALLERPGQLVSREDLIARVWPKGVVDYEAGLNTAVRKLRAALSDDADKPRYIETIPRRGYRFIGVVEAASPVATNAAVVNEVTPAVAAPHSNIVEVSAVGQLPESKKSRLPLVVTTVAIMAAIAAWVIAQRTDHAAAPVASRAESQVPLPENSVAVLPFEDMSSHGEDEFLAFGLAESILDRLASLPQLTVIARTSSFNFRSHGADAREIGRKLNARYLLEGSLQREAETWRVTAQLIDAATGSHLWSTKFDRPAKNIFAVQDEIALKVASAMSVTLSASQAQRAAGQGTTNLDAYLEYLRGRKLAHTYRAEDLQAAVGHYTRAIELDPNFSRAYSGMAAAKRNALDFHANDNLDQEWRKVQAECRALLEKALALDANNSDAYETLAAIEDDPARAEMYDRRSLQIAPNSPQAQFGMFKALLWTSPATRLDEAIAHLERAMVLDPVEPRYPTEMATVALYSRTDDLHQVEPLLRKALAMNPNYFPALTRLAELRYCCERKEAEGIKFAEQALVQDSTSTWARNFLMHMYIEVHDIDAAVAILSESKDTQVGWQSIHEFRHEWQQAAELAYSENAVRVAGPDGTMFAISMYARAPGQLQRALQHLEKSVPINWDEHGDPVLLPSFGSDRADHVAIADLYQLKGDTQRAQRLLEAVLSNMDVTAKKYRRGDLWFGTTRARAFALLGRRAETLQAVEQLSSHAMSYKWRHIAADPAFDFVRSEPRFTAAMKRLSDHTQMQFEQVRRMRADGLIPDRSMRAIAAK